MVEIGDRVMPKSTCPFPLSRAVGEVVIIGEDMICIDFAKDGIYWNRSEEREIVK